MLLHLACQKMKNCLSIIFLALFTYYEIKQSLDGIL